MVARSQIKQVPFGYKVHPDNENLLEPVVHELEALELAKRHLKQYSSREVANWLTKETGRYISHVGLLHRIDIERRRKKAATIKRQLAKRLEKTLKEINKLSKEGIGSYTEIETDEDGDNCCNGSCPSCCSRV